MRKAMSKKVICFAVVGSMLTTNCAFASEIMKDESVYVTLTENGAAKETIVSDWIHSESNLGEICDFSKLENIKNVKGEEKPDKNGDEMVWNSENKDIFYTGNTNLELPQGVNITYYLNDDEISPKDIAGKSGTVKIKMKFENKAKHTVNINGKNKDIYTPMTTIAVINLPEDTFTKVTAPDGQVISEGNNQVVTFIAFPGMKESLGLDDLDDVDLNLKMSNEFEITAEAKDFNMKPIYITCTPTLPDVEGFREAKNFDELKDGIKKLKDAGNDIAKGCNDLNAGINTAKDGVGLAKDRVDEVVKKMAQSKNKLALIEDDSKVKEERKLMSDAYTAMNMDTSSVVSLLPTLMTTMTPQNKLFLNKCMKDYAALDVNAIMNDPMLKLLPSMATPENVANIAKLLQDTDELSKIDMNKIKPMLGILEAAPQLKVLLGQAVELNKNVNVQQIQGLIGAQQEQGKTFVTSADQLNTLYTKENIAALDTITDPVKKEQLKKLVVGYNKLVNETEKNIKVSGQQLAAMAPALKQVAQLQNSLNAHPELIQGLNATLSDKNIKYLNEILPKIVGMQQDLKANEKNLGAAKLMLAKIQDPKSQKTLQQIKVIQQDVETAKPMIAKIQGSLTPDMLEKLKQSPEMINQLTSMQEDLKRNEDILNIVNDSLKKNNVEQARQLIGAVPSLTDKVNQLYDGMNQLADGSKQLCDGVDKFNEEGINKIDSKVSPMIDDVDDVLASKDELVKLSDNYESFSGIHKDMDGTVKFIMKTDEIKVPEVKEETAKKEEVEEEKVSFFQWLKNLFN